MTYHIEEPFGTGSVTAQYAVMQLAREKNVTVLLDGQGADEVLAGYTYLFYHFFLEQARYNKINYRKEKKAYAALYNQKFNTGYLFWLYAYKPSLYNKMLELKHSDSLAKNSYLDQQFIKKYSRAAFVSKGSVVNNLNQNLFDSINSGQL